MSGPVTLEYLLVQSAILGAARLLEGVNESSEILAQQNAARRAEAGARRQSEIAACERAAKRLAELQASLARMSALSATLGANIDVAIPPAPATRDRTALDRHVAALDAELARVQAAFRARAAELAAEGAATIDAQTLERLANPKSAGELLDAYAAARAEQSRRSEIERLLAPLGDSPALTHELEAVVRELAAPASDSRAQALELELRRLVAAEQARRAESKRQRAEAVRLLARFDEFEPDASTRAIVQALELAAAGAIPLDDEVAARAHALAVTLARTRDRGIQTAAAHILEGTLRDLGFTVEPIKHTLFVEGGVAHFTRSDWGDYAVRLRANPADGTLNFNVVREQGTEAADPLSTRLRDSLAEETWCAHIPKLTETLESRGIGLKIRRRLAAGEAPAQVVPAGTLDVLQTDASGALVVPHSRTQELP